MRHVNYFLALLLLIPTLALAQPAQRVQGVGTAAAAAGGVVSVYCVSGCSGGGGGSNVTVVGPLGTQATAAAVSTTAVNFPATVSVNTGATGASSPRVTVAGDTATIAGSAPGTAQSLSANVLTTAAPTSNFVTGTANVANTASTSLIALVASNRIYVTAYSCSNSGSSATIVSFQDGNGGSTIWTAEVPAGGGHVAANGNFPMFKTTSGTALYFASGTSSTTVYCSAAGFSGG